MGSKHRLAPRLAELFATLPPGPAIDAFSGSGVVAYTLKATGRDDARQRPPDVHDDARRGAGRQPGRAAERRGGRRPLLAQPRRSRLHRRDLRRALLPGRRPRVPGRRLVTRRRAARRQAGAGAERALPGRGLEAATRRVHGHHAALRRRPAPAPHAARGALPGGGGALQRRRASGRARERDVRRRVRARPGGRRARLPRPAVRAAPRRHVLRQALPLPRGPGDVLARPGDHVGDAHAQAGQAPHAVRVQAHGARRARPPVRPFQRSARAGRLLRLERRPRRRRARGAAGAAIAALSVGSRSRIATRSGLTPLPRGVERPSRCSSRGHDLYSDRCRRW